MSNETVFGRASGETGDVSRSGVHVIEHPGDVFQRQHKVGRRYLELFVSAFALRR